MSETTTIPFRRWFTYEQDSHAKVMAAFAAVSPPRRAEPGFQMALDLMAHLVQCRWLWLHRFGAWPEPPGDIFPIGVPLTELPGRLTAVETAWDDYLERLTEAELARRFSYRSLDGRGFENSVEEILTQLFGHSWYHRGQIAALLRGLGAQPAVTDYVFWSRRPVH